MSREQNRLAPGTHPFIGRDIDRGRPLSFRLDGQRIHGLAGDTVFSAVIASGIIAAGSRRNDLLALDERFAPMVLLRALRNEPSAALPMERLPAIDGLDLVTLAAAGRADWTSGVAMLQTRLSHYRGSLGLRYDGMGLLAGSWLTQAPQRDFTADVVVVGGGVAGMSAALAAGRSGERVLLIERRQTLGGDARLFGRTGEEESPDTLIDRTVKAIGEASNITTLVGTEAFALAEGAVRAHLVDLDEGRPKGRVIGISAPRIIIATGMIERLPIFPGNRLPGVVGAAAAFDRADRHGIWIGKRAVVATVTNVAYRLAAHAKNAGIAVDRIADSRAEPQSRFIDFSKAHGIPLSRAIRPALAEPQKRPREGLTAWFESAFDGVEADEQPFVTDQLVLAGGWQPELTLWHLAGGTSRWHRESGRIEAEGTLAGIGLAGSAAGFRNTGACLKSGQAAMARLLGRSAQAIDDTQIDPIHESPDDPTQIAAFDDEAVGDAYLDGGASLTVRPSAARRVQFRLWPTKRPPLWGFADQTRPLGIADVAAGVQLGVIPPQEAPMVVQERCAMPGDIVEAGRSQTAILPGGALPSGTMPAYLAGRFGPKQAVWVIEAADGRAFEVGCLIYAEAGRTDPLTAVGVVFAAAPNPWTGGLAVLGKPLGVEGSEFVVRERSGTVAARLHDPAKPRLSPAPPETAAAPAADPAPVAEPVEIAAAEAAAAPSQVEATPLGPIATSLAPPPPPLSSSEKVGAAWSWDHPRRRSHGRLKAALSGSPSAQSHFPPSRRPLRPPVPARKRWTKR